MLVTIPEQVAISSTERYSLSNRLIQHLTSYEFDHLINALRRDMRAEGLLAYASPDWYNHHRQNSRKSLDLLEILNPKHAQI